LSLILLGSRSSYVIIPQTGREKTKKAVIKTNGFFIPTTKLANKDYKDSVIVESQEKIITRKSLFDSKANDIIGYSILRKVQSKSNIVLKNSNNTNKINNKSNLGIIKDNSFNNNDNKTKKKFYKESILKSNSKTSNDSSKSVNFDLNKADNTARISNIINNESKSMFYRGKSFIVKSKMNSFGLEGINIIFNYYMIITYFLYK